MTHLTFTPELSIKASMFVWMVRILPVLIIHYRSLYAIAMGRLSGEVTNLVHLYIAPGQDEIYKPCWQLFWWKQKGLINFIAGCMFQTKALPSDFMHIFHNFIHIILGLGLGRQPIRAKTLMSTEDLIISTSDFIHIVSWFNKCI